MAGEQEKDLRDHDLLIRLNTKMESFEISMTANLKDLKDNVVARISSLEARSAENDIFHDQIKTTIKVWGIVFALIVGIIELAGRFWNKL
jgi:hypothetical protein